MGVLDVSNFIVQPDTKQINVSHSQNIKCCFSLLFWGGVFVVVLGFCFAFITSQAFSPSLYGQVQVKHSNFHESHFLDKAVPMKTF